MPHLHVQGNGVHLQRRFTTQPTRVGDYLVPPGVFVYILFHRLHNSAKLWHEPDVFCPERWDVQPAKHSPGMPLEAAEITSAAADAPEAAAAEPERGDAKAYLPFSEGSRSCIAQVAAHSWFQWSQMAFDRLRVLSDMLWLQNLALMELRVALAVLSANFTFTLAPSMGGPEDVRAAERMALTLHVHGGVHMHCHPRADAHTA